MAALVAGDRIAYAAKFLRNIGAYTGAMPQQRGTFLKQEPAMPGFARVRWDGWEDQLAHSAKLYGNDFAADVRENGNLVHAANIIKVGSPQFVMDGQTA